jgi:LysR family nitrogen assimilation transcriptional regulator
MQFRHLRYFVKIVEAGSFSRAAATIHVAQSALSQQIAELEERIGLSLLQRNPRGVRPTAAGEVFYREASAVLRQLEQLPSLLRASSGETEGAVSLGFAISISVAMCGPFLETCRAQLPKVTLKFADGDSESLGARITANNLDMALVYEDEFVPTFSRKPLYRQRLFLVSAKTSAIPATSISLDKIARLPLVLPSLPNGRRRLVDRAFIDAGLSPNLIAETDTLSSELSAVRTGIGHTILNVSSMNQSGFAEPVMIEPAIFLTCSVVSSGDFPLTHAGEAVRNMLIQFVKDHIDKANRRGAEWIG